jgi:hypothetical protein
MVRINRPAIRADVEQIAARFDLFFRAVMTMLAQRLKGAGEEKCTIAMVGRDVVSDSGRHRKTLLQAKFAQRVDR